MSANPNSNNPAQWAGFKAPRGYQLAWKVVRPDGRTYGDFQWPFKGRVAADPGDLGFTTGFCPRFSGDGLCLAKTWDGAASGGLTAITGLAIAYRERDVLASSEHKLRVSECRVLGVLDLQRLIREGCAAGAILTGANLRGAILTGADLTAADLTAADLNGADLTAAGLTGASLTRANLRGADLNGADLTAAGLTGAGLTRANLRGASLNGADLTAADLTRADLTAADLTAADLTGACMGWDGK